MPESRQAGPARLILTLATAGFLSGTLLVSVFVWTQPRILQNQAEALEAAIFRVLPGAATRAAMHVVGDSIAAAPDGKSDGPVVFAGYDAAGKLVGYAIPAEGPGFQDAIKLLCGYDAVRGRVVGMEVLDSRETPGLGDKIVKDAAFHANFTDLEPDPEIVVVKPGESSAENEVDGISGATISSKAVVSILNQALSEWRPALDKEGGS